MNIVNLYVGTNCIVELGPEQFEARAIVIESAEWDGLRSIQLQKLPGLVGVLAKTIRKIPVVLLERKKEREE